MASDSVQIILEAQDRASKAIGGVETKLLGMTKSARLLHRQTKGVANFASALDVLGGTNLSGLVSSASILAEVGQPISDALRGIKNNPKVVGAIDGLGGFMGSKLGTSLGVAGGAAIGVALFEIWQQGISDLHAKMGELKTVLGNDQAAAVEAAKSPWLGLANTIGIGLGSIPTTFTQEIGASLQGINGVVQDAAAGIGQKGSMALVNAMKKTLADSESTFIHSAQGIDSDLAQGLQSNVGAVSDAMAKVTWAIEHPMAMTTQKANLEGAITTLQYSRGLKSNSNEVNTVIDQQIADLEKRWANLTGKAWDAGAATGHAWTAAYNRALSRITGGTGLVFGHRVNLPGMAGGGYLPPGGAAVVGERGPEIVRAGRQGATVTPNGGGGPIIVNIDGRELFRIMDQRAGRSQALSPSSSYARG